MADSLIHYQRWQWRFLPWLRSWALCKDIKGGVGFEPIRMGEPEGEAETAEMRLAAHAPEMLDALYGLVEALGSEVSATQRVDALERGRRVLKALKPLDPNTQTEQQTQTTQDTPAAPDHALLLSALASGIASIDGNKGLRSICVSGNAHYGFECDDLGCPILHGSLRKALVAATAR